MENNYGVTIGGIIALMVAILVAVMIYFSIAQTGEFPLVTERWTGLTNSSNIVKTLTYPPNSASDFSGTWYNDSALSENWGTLNSTLFTRDGRTLTLKTNSGGAGGMNMTKVNVSYYTATGVAVKNNINPAATTTFTLAPIIGLVMIAAIILGYVSVFGKPKA